MYIHKTIIKFLKSRKSERIIKIKEKFLNLIYPPICGICGKKASNFLCRKCEMKLEKHSEKKILNEEEIKGKYFEEIIYCFKYEGMIRKLILDYKFNDKSYLYKTFSSFVLKDEKIFEKIQKYDKIVPVPISKKRRRDRGYNQSFLIAKEISLKSKVNLLNNCLIKTKNIVEQSKLNKEKRFENIKGVYKLKNKNVIENKKVLLIDDIYTTGSTVNECSKILRQGNPSEIGILVLAKD